MSMAAHDRRAVPHRTAANSAAGRSGPWRLPDLFDRLSSQFGTLGSRLRGETVSESAHRELLLRGTAGIATILDVRHCSETMDGPAAVAATTGYPQSGHMFRVRVQLDGHEPYEIRVRQRVAAADLEWMQPGDIAACKVDPGDRDRVVLHVPDPEETTRADIAKVLANGRRADATVLAAAPAAIHYTGIGDPVLRLDLELCAWDEPLPWRVRIVQAVPLAAIELVDRGRHVEVAFFAVDRGESVAVDWTASLDD